MALAAALQAVGDQGARFLAGNFVGLADVVRVVKTVEAESLPFEITPEFARLHFASAPRPEFPLLDEQRRLGGHYSSAHLPQRIAQGREALIGSARLSCSPRRQVAQHLD